MAKFHGRTQNIMPRNIAVAIPLINDDGDGETKDLVAHVKLFTPYSGWTWLICERAKDVGSPGHGEGELVFAYAYNANDPDLAELGYVSISELREIGAKRGCYTFQGVERDVHFQSKPLLEAIKTECPRSRLAA